MKNVPHERSNDYRIYHADGCIGTQIANGRVQIIFFQDATKITHETLVPIPGTPNGFSTIVPEDAIKQYRQDVVSTTLSLTTVESLIQLLSSTLSAWKSHPHAGEAAK